MLQYFDTLTDGSGNALLGATVTVTQYPSNALATIYSTNGTTSPIATSVVSADITGQISFYAPDGAYTLTYAYKGTTYKTRSPVQFLDPMGFVAATDTGAVNAYVVSGAAYPAQKYVGLKLEFKATNTNTGASALNYQSDGGIAINLPGGNPLLAGMIQANGLTRMEWDGVQWQLVGAQSQPFYAITPAEQSAALTPLNYSKFPSPWKDISRFVTDNTGVADVSGQFANALAAEKNIIVPAGTYNLGTTGIVLPSDVYFQCAGRNNVKFVYSGSGVAIDGFGKNNLALSDFAVDTTANVAATAMRFGNAAQHIWLQNIALTGNQTAGNTGIGLLLDAANPGSFSGNLIAELFYTLGYKFGVKMTGHDVGTNTWTSVSFLQTYLLGRGAGIIAGSSGLWMDPNTNGVGSVFHGGSIEGYDVGLKVEAGSCGLDFVADLEGNNTNYTYGNTFSGRIKVTNSTGELYEAACNGAANFWYRRQLLSGFGIREETFYPSTYIQYDGAGSGQTWGLYRGQSKIDGGTPVLKMGFTSGISTDTVEARNFITLNGHHLTWDVQSPQTTGLFVSLVGDFCLNAAAASGQPMFWFCTAAGTPGTWKPGPNLP